MTHACSTARARPARRLQKHRIQKMITNPRRAAPSRARRPCIRAQGQAHTRRGERMTPGSSARAVDAGDATTQTQGTSARTSHNGTIRDADVQRYAGAEKTVIVHRKRGAKDAAGAAGRRRSVSKRHAGDLGQMNGGIDAKEARTNISLMHVWHRGCQAPRKTQARDEEHTRSCSITTVCHGVTERERRQRRVSGRQCTEIETTGGL